MIFPQFKYMNCLILMMASEEQRNISNELNNYNVIVEAVSGSGKTTAAEIIALDHVNDEILLLTYNKRLRLETQDRAIKKGLLNLTVHNYHSFAVKYYHHSCHNDSSMKKHLKTPKNKEFRFTMFIIDEIQDMTELYYKLVVKIIGDNQYIPKICVLGDRRQSIYTFNGADQRYLTMADQLFNFNDRPWKRLKLSESFRVSKAHCDFINNAVLHKPLMNSKKETHHKPVYLLCDAFNKRPFLEVMKYLKSYSCEDIFILAPSIKSEGSPVKKLANSLSQNGVNIYLPTSDNDKLDEDIIKHKLVISSFHQVKGLERKVVIVFSFDKGYFDFCDQRADTNVCPNTIYVAITRSLEHMTLIHHYQCNYLPFLNHHLLPILCSSETVEDAITNKSLNPAYICKFNGKTINERILEDHPTKVIDCVLHRTAKNIKTKSINITCKKLCDNIPSKIIDEAIFEIMQIQRIKPCMPSQNIVIATKTNQTAINESVSEINDIAIPAYYEFITTRKMTIIEKLKSNSFIKETKSNFFTEDDEKEEDEDDDYSNITYDDMTVEKLLYISNLYMCTFNKVIHKLHQITNYKWLNMDQLTKCHSRLNVISNRAIYLKSQAIGGCIELRNKQLQATIDCIDDKYIYMFVCNPSITNKDILVHTINMYVYCLHNKIGHLMTNEKRFIMERIGKRSKAINDLNESKTKIGKSYPLLKKLGISGNLIRDIDKMIQYSSLKIVDDYMLSEQCQDYSFRILNIVTGETIELVASMEKLTNVVDFVIRKKYYSTDNSTDEEFLEMNKKE